MGLLLLMSFSGLALAEDTDNGAEEERILLFNPIVSVEPGLTVVPGTELTLTLLPESFPNHPDLNLEEAGLAVTWYLDTEDELIELGEGISCTTVPMETQFNHGIIYPELAWVSETDFFDSLHELHTYFLELTVSEPGGGNPDAKIMQAGQEGKQSLLLVNTDGICDADVWMEADGKTIAGLAPDEEDEVMGEGASFEWLQTDADWNPVTGVLGSAFWFTPPSALEGTRYYICRGYLNQQPVAGEARFICRTVRVPDFRALLSPPEVYLGESVTAAAVFGDEVMDPHGSAVQTLLTDWIAQETEEDVASLEDVAGDWYIMSWGEVEYPTENPALIDNITEDFADAEFAYTLSASYSTAQYSGTLTWDTMPVMLTVLDENGDPVTPGGSGGMYLIIDDLFSEDAHLTQENLAAAIEEMLEIPVSMEVIRNDELLPPDMWCATNDYILLYDDDGSLLEGIPLVIRGDVLGTGTMDISQVVRVAQALTGQSPLEGAYLEAGSFNDTEETDIGDLVAMAALLRDAVRS